MKASELKQLLVDEYLSNNRDPEVYINMRIIRHDLKKGATCKTYKASIGDCLEYDKDVFLLNDYDFTVLSSSENLSIRKN